MPVTTKARTKSAVMLTLIGSFLFGSVCAAQPSRANPVWVLSQKDKRAGAIRVYVSDEAVKIENPRDKILVAARKPDWQIYLLNRSSKRYCRIPLKKYSGQLDDYLRLFKGIDFRRIPIALKGKTTFNSYPANYYMLDPGRSASYQLTEKQSGTRTNKVARAVTFLTLSDLPNAERSGALICRYYGLPDAPGIPILFKFTDIEGQGHNKLSTFSIRKQPSGGDIFKDLLTGYKEVANEKRVREDNDHKKDTKIYSESLGPRD